jgi:anti-sigma factor ChrR (cupin superfamily)
MMLNMQFDQRVMINTVDHPWQPSPVSGVWRKPLAREGAERGHATSIVRYGSGASFPRHGHPLGEEILVLEGTFSDEHGDFGAGTYFRNPPGSSHAPFSKDGCILLVKLHQFLPHDLAQVCIDTRRACWLAGDGNLKVMPLHEFAGEHVALVKWPAGEKSQPHRHLGGEEIFVLSGEFRDEHGTYPRGTWLRSPHMSEHSPFVEQETVVWVKTGHLPGVDLSGDRGSPKGGPLHRS